MLLPREQTPVLPLVEGQHVPCRVEYHTVSQSSSDEDLQDPSCSRLLWTRYSYQASRDEVSRPWVRGASM